MDDFDQKREFLSKVMDHIVMDHNGNEHEFTFNFKHGIPPKTKKYSELRKYLDTVELIKGIYEEAK